MIEYLEGFINVLSSFSWSMRKLCAFHNQEIFLLLFPRQGNVDPWPLCHFHLRCFLSLSIVVCLQLWMRLSRWFWSVHSLMLLIMVMMEPVWSLVLMMMISEARSLLDLVRRRWRSLWTARSGHRTPVIDGPWWWSVGWSIFLIPGHDDDDDELQSTGLFIYLKLHTLKEFYETKKAFYFFLGV